MGVYQDVHTTRLTGWTAIPDSVGDTIALRESQTHMLPDFDPFGLEISRRSGYDPRVTPMPRDQGTVEGMP